MRRDGAIILLLLSAIALYAFSGLPVSGATNSTVIKTHQNPEHSVFTPSTESEVDTEIAVLFVSMTLVLVVALSFVYGEFVPTTVKAVLPESAAVCLCGIVIGLILREVDALRDFIVFDPEVFFTVLLPPIIFYAGYSLHKEHGSFFFSNIGTILVFAVGGTLISTVVIALLTMIVSATPIVNLSIVECWLFGSLISAVDPVATIAIFESFKVNNKLFNMVFGESVLNDAVAIVMYRTVNRFTKADVEFSAGNFFFAIFEFGYISVGSIAIGISFGLIFSLCTKHLRLKGDLPTLSIIIFAYLGYVIAEVSALSGIMAILSYGITTSHYAWHNLEEQNQVVSYTVARMLGMTAESFVFAYIGMSVFGFKDHHFNAGFVITGYIICMVGRALNIFPLSNLINNRKKDKVPQPMQIVLWFSGLRGAIAFGLALDVGTEHQHAIKTTTLAIVLITTFLHGGLTLPLLTKLGYVDKSKHIALNDRSAHSDVDSEDEEAESESSLFFMRWDRKYFTPFFVATERIPTDRKFIIENGDNGAHTRAADSFSTFSTTDRENGVTSPQDLSPPPPPPLSAPDGGLGPGRPGAATITTPVSSSPADAL